MPKWGLVGEEIQRVYVTLGVFVGERRGLLFAIVVYYLVLACNGHLSNLQIYIFGNKSILCVRYFILFAAFYTICQLFFPHLKFSVKSCNTVFDIDAIQDYHPNRKQYASTLRLWQLHIRVNCCKYLVVRRSSIIGKAIWNISKNIYQNIQRNIKVEEKITKY